MGKIPGNARVRCIVEELAVVIVLRSTQKTEVGVFEKDIYILSTSTSATAVPRITILRFMHADIAAHDTVAV